MLRWEGRSALAREIEQTVPGNVNLPIIPDKVVDSLRKGKDVPLEAISEAAAEMKEDHLAKRKAPVHAEDLRPITKAQAASMVSGTTDGKLQHGVMPRAPASRRVIPAPFRRPSISMQLPWEPRPVWGYCRADQVQAGDIVPDLGKVVGTDSRIRYADAAEQVPVTVKAAEPIVVQEWDADTSALLLEAYGSHKVAVGYEILLTGAGGKVLALDAQEEVRVFRVPPEGETGAEEAQLPG